MVRLSCPRWDDYMNSVMQVFQNFLSTEAMADVTLACDGLSLKAHKIVLSACSPFFQSLFLDNPCKHPIVIINGMKYTHLKAVVDFMYRGEVNVPHGDVSSVMKAANTLKVKGLCDVTKDERQSDNESSDSNLSTPARKRRRHRTQKRSVHDRNDEEILEYKSDRDDSDVEQLFSNTSCSMVPTFSLSSPKQHKSDDVEPGSKQSTPARKRRKQRTQRRSVHDQNGEEILEHKSDYEDSDVEQLFSNTSCSKVSKFSLSSHKLQQVPEENESSVEEVIEEVEGKYFPEFEMLLKQQLTDENSSRAPVQSEEPEDDFLPEIVMLLRQTKAEEGTTDTHELPAHPSSDIDELPTHPGSDIDELPTHPGSDIDDPVQSKLELQEQPHNTTYHSTLAVTPFCGSDSAVSDTCATVLTSPSAEDLRMGTSTDEAALSNNADENFPVQGQQPNNNTTTPVLSTSQNALVLYNPENTLNPGSTDYQFKGHKDCNSVKGPGRPRKIRNSKKTMLNMQPRKNANHTSASIPDTCTSKQSETSKGIVSPVSCASALNVEENWKCVRCTLLNPGNVSNCEACFFSKSAEDKYLGEGNPPHTPGENACVNIGQPDETAKSVLTASQNAPMQGSTDSQLEVHKKRQAPVMNKVVGSPPLVNKPPSRNSDHQQSAVLKSIKGARCNICKKHFSSKYYLSTHMHIHAEEKPYACDFCDYKCCFSYLLKNHQKKCSVREESCNKASDFCD